MSALMPVVRHQRVLAELEKRGVRLELEDMQVWGLQEAITWIDWNMGIVIPLPQQATAASFLNYPLDEQVLKAITSWKSLKVVAMRQATISDHALKQFVEQSPQLGYLYIISCPEITPLAIDQLRTTHPALQIEYRGTAFLGVRGDDTPLGCMVYYVQAGSPADQIGLRTGDVIENFAGEKTLNFQHLIEQISYRQPGDQVQLSYSRNGQNITVNCVLQSWQSR